MTPIVRSFAVVFKRPYLSAPLMSTAWESTNPSDARLSFSLVARVKYGLPLFNVSSIFRNDLSPVSRLTLSFLQPA